MYASLPHCGDHAGFNLHVGVRVAAHGRRRLERVARYILRPPICLERLTLREEGRLVYALKRLWLDGTTAVVLTPFELLERLVALVPPPRRLGVPRPAAAPHRASQVCSRAPGWRVPR